MIDPRFVFLGAALSMVGTLSYALLTVRGEVKPNRVSWFLWAAASLTGFGAQLDDGVGLPAVLTFSMGAGPAVVFLASFANRSSYWRLSFADLLCGAASVVALAIWLGWDDPQTAVIFAVFGDLAAAIPTFRKAWSAPGSENPLVFGLVAVNGIITLLTITVWKPAVWAFPVYATTLGAGLFLIIVVRQRIAGGRAARTRQPK
ncbi:hypothetical protein HGA13_31050 [Nocardia speluncae]|uniref:Uncharacterized protein n=1 Tax=Nocardia speluncae TaxID=419477 RepID=A0A846XMB3_9NOCA|nr:hypothetical protein [Nocardia speluncae]NKY37471.1 hypothetical protein [Nocardia speluncae]